MNVIVSVGGTFHGFHLAEQLDRRGHLTRLLTTHRPRRGERISATRIRTFLIPELIARAPQQVGLHWQGDHLAVQLFDWWAQRHLEPSDMLVAFAAFGLHTIRAAKPRGTVTVVERASAHVLHQHELLADEYRRWNVKIPPIDPRLVERQLWEYGEADYVAVPSSFVRESFIRRGMPEHKLITVPLGAEVERFRPGAGQADGVFRIVTAGLSLQKGTPYLLEALRRLKTRAVDLVLAGRIEPELRPILREYHGLFRHVGVLSPDELARLFASSSVLVLPSIQDGFGMVVVQAMASGLPVICTFNTGVSDLIRNGEHGFIVPIRDPDAIAERLDRLATDEPARRMMGQAAMRQAQSYSWAAYGDRICAEYSRVLAPTSRAEASSPREFYETFWSVSDLWGTNTGWSEHDYRRHFDGVIAPDQVVLDIGCGDARAYHMRMLKEVRELHGVDISSPAVERARRKGLLARVHDLASPLPYPDGMFDVVICLEVLEHLFDPKFAVHEIVRVAKPGGRIVVSVPNAGYFRDRLVMLARGVVPAGVTDYVNPWKAPHIRFFTAGSLIKLLSACGLEVIRLRSKTDPSLLDAFDVFEAPGRFLGRTIGSRLPKLLRGAFLGNLWPSLFAPGLIAVARRPLVLAEPATQRRVPESDDADRLDGLMSRSRQGSGGG